MNPEMMREALMRRKANGLDITILLNPHEEEHQEEDEARELDMAPPAEELGDGDEMKDEAMSKMGEDMQALPDNSMVGKGDDEQRKMMIQKELGRLGRGTLASKMKY